MKRIFLSATIVLIALTPAIAQNTASIHGRVTDERNANISGVEVRLRSRAGAYLLAATNDNGEYSFKSVPPGDYILEVAAKGFATFTSKELSLVRGQLLSSDVHLS